MGPRLALSEEAPGSSHQVGLLRHLEEGDALGVVAFSGHVWRKDEGREGGGARKEEREGKKGGREGGREGRIVRVSLRLIQRAKSDKECGNARREPSVGSASLPPVLPPSTPPSLRSSLPPLLPPSPPT